MRCGRCGAPVDAHSERASSGVSRLASCGLTRVQALAVLSSAEASDVSGLRDDGVFGSGAWSFLARSVRGSVGVVRV